jgi:hypothetical protein
MVVEILNIKMEHHDSLFALPKFKTTFDRAVWIIALTLVAFGAILAALI